MTVELDVFSGRPNPRWTLTEPEKARVEELLRELPEGEGSAPAGLGFRGFVLSDGQRRIVVSGGAVRVEGGSFEDARGLAAYLRELARERGYGELVR